MQRKKGVLFLSILMVFVLASCSQVEQPSPSVSPSEEVKPTIYESMEPSPVVSPSTEPTPSAVVTPSVEPSPIPSLSPSVTPAQEQKPNSNSVTTSSGGTTTEKLPSPPPAPAPSTSTAEQETEDAFDALDKWNEEMDKTDTRTQEEKDQFNINASQPISDSSSGGMSEEDRAAQEANVKWMEEQAEKAAEAGKKHLEEQGIDPNHVNEDVTFNDDGSISIKGH